MKKEIVIAGFGGQGVMSIGKSLVEAGLEEGLEDGTVEIHSHIDVYHFPEKFQIK